MPSISGSRSVQETRLLTTARSFAQPTAAVAAPPSPLPPARAGSGPWPDLAASFRQATEAVGSFWSRHQQTILAVADVALVGAQIACMVIPGLQPVALGLAVVSATRAASVLGRGLIEGRADLVLEGSIGLVTSLAAGVGSLGARIAGQGLLAGATLVGRGARVADRLMAFARAIRDGDRMAYLFGPAEILVSAAGFCGPRLEALAGRLAGYAGSLRTLADALGRIQRGLSWQAAFGAGISGTRLVGMVATDLAARPLVETSSRVAEDAEAKIRRGLETAAALPPLALAVSGLGLAAIGARYWQLAPSDRLIVSRSLDQARAAWEAGDFGTAKRAAATGLGTGLGWPPGEADRVSDQQWTDWLTLLAAVGTSAAQNNLDASTNALQGYMRRIRDPGNAGT